MTKKTCFVIMPFAAPYKERCKQTYAPAIEAAGLVPHLAGGPGVNVITEDIEKGIRASFLCFADISEDNPNVWYELGFAYACGKQVVMVCDKAKRPGQLPFDVSVKKVILYKSDYDSDEIARNGFQQAITKDMQAKAAKVVAPVVGGGAIASSQSQGGMGVQLPKGWEPMDRIVFKEILNWYAKHGRPLREMQGDYGGYALLSSSKNPFQTKTSVNRLIGKGLMARVQYEDNLMDEVYDGLVPTSAGEEFASKHSELLV